MTFIKLHILTLNEVKRGEHVVKESSRISSVPELEHFGTTTHEYGAETV
jgi:hypothetical protein